LEKGEEESGRGSYIEALGGIGPDAKESLPILQKYMTSEVAFDRMVAANAMLKIDPASKAPIQVLLTEIKDPQSEDRMTAARSLWRSREQRATILAMLIDALRDEKQQWGALYTLEAIGPEAKDALPALKGLLKDKKTQNIRRELRRALGKIAPPE
jgi:HEAT repeat protein